MDLILAWIGTWEESTSRGFHTFLHKLMVDKKRLPQCFSHACFVDPDAVPSVLAPPEIFQGPANIFWRSLIWLIFNTLFLHALSFPNSRGKKEHTLFKDLRHWQHNWQCQRPFYKWDIYLGMNTDPSRKEIHSCRAIPILSRCDGSHPEEISEWKKETKPNLGNSNLAYPQIRLPPFQLRPDGFAAGKAMKLFSVECNIPPRTTSSLRAPYRQGFPGNCRPSLCSQSLGRKGSVCLPTHPWVKQERDPFTDLRRLQQF